MIIASDKNAQGFVFTTDFPIERRTGWGLIKKRWSVLHFFSRPYRTEPYMVGQPSDESLGYCQPSLRDWDTSEPHRCVKQV